MNLFHNVSITGLLVLMMVQFITGCSTPTYPYLPEATGQMHHSSKYKIAAGDKIQIYVWRYPEVSTSVVVRPDGFLTAPLLEDVPAAGKTPTELARDIEQELSVYLRDPLVTVMLEGGQGVFPEQIRVVGEAAKPRAMPYQDGMTLLDLMIQVGGLTEYADGNHTILIRVERGIQQQFTVRTDDLVKDGDITANVDLMPGDILIIPESWF